MSFLIVTIDQGSSSTTVLAVDREGRQVASTSLPLRIERSHEVRAEQDPLHILR